MNGLRTVLNLRPGLNRRRIFHFGGSQGGHIALLSGIYAPNTFSFIYAASSLVYAEDKFEKRGGRNFTPWERKGRDVLYHGEKILYINWSEPCDSVNLFRWK